MFNISRHAIVLNLIVLLVAIFLCLPSFFPKFFEGSAFEKVKINLGLDLKGGSSTSLVIDMKSYDQEQLFVLADEILAQFKAAGIKLSKPQVFGHVIVFRGSNVQDIDMDEIEDLLLPHLGESFNLESTKDTLRITLRPVFFENKHRYLIDQSLEIIRRRIDQSGLKEIEIQKQGKNSIMIQIPGVTDPQEVQRIIGKTAKLTFHIVDEEVAINDVLRRKKMLPSHLKLLPMETEGEEGNIYVAVEKKPSLTGEMLINAQATVKDGMPLVAFTFSSAGAKRFAKLTSSSIGKRLAIVLDDVIISAPFIREEIPNGYGTISGNFSMKSANELAILLKAGALPAPIDVVEERIVGPSLGKDSIEDGIKASILGAVLVCATMIIAYRMFGVMAILGLILNMFLLLSFMAISGASLTLYGIAGIILTMGIAVDSNILIIERIKDEYKEYKNVLKSIDRGFSLALSTILDANITTIFTAILLYIFAEGPIKGFAITLIFGIISSMFSAVFFVRSITALWYKKFKPIKLSL